MPNQLFLAGASVRAAAQSAARSGFTVTAADLFCDRDLVTHAQGFQIRDYPRGLQQFALRHPSSDWAYTGGLENEPDLVDDISQHHQLCGNPGSVLRSVRDPWHLADTLARHDVSCPVPRIEPDWELSQSWVRKPRRSCGGNRIRLFEVPSVHNPDPVPVTRAFFYQPFLNGPSYSAVYVAANGQSRCLGITRQLVGCRWAGAKPFQYVGSIGPIPLDDHYLRRFHRVGEVLASEYSLQGLFGVDTIVADNEVWVVEVNPRYCASVEVIERASGLPGMAVHIDACRNRLLPGGFSTPPSRFFGKSIVFARRSTVATPTLADLIDDRAGSVDAFADLPPCGAEIDAGHPILTVFAQAHGARDVLRQLRLRTRQVHAAVGT